MRGSQLYTALFFPSLEFFPTGFSLAMHPCGYVGGDELLFPNTHWAGMTVQECYQLIEDRTGEPVEKLYYCVPGMPLSTGIRWIEDDVDYAFWLDTGEENGEIAVYADNSGMTLDEWWDEDMNLVVSEDESGLEDDEGATEGGQSQPQGGNGNGHSQPQGGNVNGQSQPQGPVDEIEHDDIIHMDKTKDDAFLSKLCPSAVDNDGNNSESDEELENYAIFNEEVHWKKQLPILGMRFQSRKQLKNMLCNYAVANGYHIRQDEDSENHFHNDYKLMKKTFCSKMGAGEKNRWDSNGENQRPHRGYRIHPDGSCAELVGAVKPGCLTLQRVRFEPQTSHKGDSGLTPSPTVEVIIGIRIKRRNNGISISQSLYVEKILKKYNFEIFQYESDSRLLEYSKQPEHSEILAPTLFILIQISLIL
ncbi:hypothetical protein LXL04_032839 [Taraxacum kok-saghyz]